MERQRIIAITPEGNKYLQNVFKVTGVEKALEFAHFGHYKIDPLKVLAAGVNSILHQ